MIDVQIDIPKDLPINKLNKYIDDTVFNIARITLDYVNTGLHFPYLTGDLNESSMAQGVTKYSKNSYYLGTDGSVDYAMYVWNMPEGTNWTRKSTYHQWYMTEFKNDKEKIISLAVKNAEKGNRI